ncbi:MAG: hypothetical protein ACOC2W_00970 [bacterium]
MVDIDNTYWDRIRGFLTEHRVDARWVLRLNNDNKPYGSLRIVSHPDLKPGYLRAIFMYVTSINEKSIEEKMKTVEDYQMDIGELEVYSVDDDIKTEKKIYEAPFKELEEVFGVKIFE